MQRVVLDGVEPGSVVRAVDARTYARGVLFAQRRAVAEMEWDGEHNALYTEVHDSGTVHEAVAYFRVRRARLDFVFGECTCPAGMNCVHVVASVLAAADTAGVGRTGTAGAHPPWERTLRSLFAPDPPSLNDLREPVPLAVELSLSAGHNRSVALSARVVRPGRTGWVGGGMSWRNVASHYSLGDCAPAHVRVLRELYALHSAGSGPSRYHYGGSDRTIDLAGVGRGLWSVLDEAADVGLQIVHARKRFGTVDRYGSAELCLDVTAGPVRGGAGDRAGVAVRRSGGDATPTRCRSCSWARRGTGWCTCHGRSPGWIPTPLTGGSGWPASPPRLRRRCAAWSWRVGSRCRRTSGRTSSTSSTPG